MIAFSLIRARRRFSEALSSSHLQLYTGRVAILIESALPLSLFGIFDAVIMFLPIQKTNIARAVHIQLVNIVPSLFYAFAVSSRLDFIPRWRELIRWLLSLCLRK